MLQMTHSLVFVWEFNAVKRGGALKDAAVYRTLSDDLDCLQSNKHSTCAGMEANILPLQTGGKFGGGVPAAATAAETSLPTPAGNSPLLTDTGRLSSSRDPADFCRLSRCSIEAGVTCCSQRRKHLQLGVRRLPGKLTETCPAPPP